MKVWCVFGWMGHEGDDLLGIFDSECKAIEFVTSCEDFEKQHEDCSSKISLLELHPAGYFYHSYDINEYEVR